MDNFNWQKVETIVDEALTLPKREQHTFVEERCKGNKKLKTEVTQFLESIFDSEGWLENPTEYKKEFYEEVSDGLEDISNTQVLVGKQIGPYKITQTLGEGGMGSVYLAERSQDKLSHQVAIKIIPQGRATSTNIQRFKREQQILANLNHPGIATFLDAGITEDGSPYIIMEYVDGIPIDEYCSRHKLSPDSRIELFKQVLKAVRHAHENLVIHRDLKPANILVDESGKVKILDFGISKLLDESRDLHLTQTGARLLTPRYAAPEQIKETNITTATDLYALGVIFYELICGCSPFELDSQSQYQAEQIILNQQPTRPSSNVSEKQLQKQLGGDLDAIALKAIRKDPTRRYRVANDFLNDLNNYQEGIPVSAREISVAYRLQKFYNRHKQGVFITTGIVALIIALVAFYTHRIAEERNLAQQQAQRAEQVKKFMLDIFNTGNPDLKNFAGSDATVDELLLAGFHRTERELQEQPEMYIEMLSAIGDALAEVDEFQPAKDALTKALKRSNQYYGSESTQSTTIRTYLADYYHDVHEYDKAEQQILKAIDTKKNHYGEGTIQLAASYSTYASNQLLQSKYKQAKELFLKADSLRRVYGKDNTVSYHISLANLGEAELFLGEYTMAEKHFEKALSFFQDYYEQSHPEIARTKYRLGLLYNNTSKHKKAETYLLQSLEEYIDLYGENSSELSANYAMLARNYRILGNWEDAKKYARKDIELTQNVYGDTSSIFAKSINNLALIQKAQGNLQQARANYEKALSIYRNNMEADNPDLAIPMYNLGDVLKDLGEYTHAQKLLEQVVHIDKSRLGSNHPEVGLDLNKLGAILMESKQYNEADSIFTQAKPIYEHEFPKNHYRIGEYLMNFGTLKYRQQEFRAAKHYFSRAVKVFKKNFDNDNERIQKGLKLLKKVNTQLTTTQ